nr:DEAD/DEAH box helicase [Saccharopolyspora sp. HNM0983]
MRNAKQNPVIFDLGAKETAPWEPGHALTSEPLHPARTWKFTVYGGLYDTRALRDALVQRFGEDGAPRDEQSAGTTALFSLTLDADGDLVEDSAALSSCGWAVGRLAADSGERPLSGFGVEQQGFRDALNKLVPPSKRSESAADSTGSAVTAALTERLTSAGTDAWSAGAAEAGAIVRTATAAAVGPIGGSIAGAAAGTFVESLIGPPDSADSTTGDAETERGPDEAEFSPTAAALHRFAQELAAHLGVTELLAPTGVRVRCATVPIRGSQDEQTDFLNSHIADDLLLVEDAVREDRWGAGLRTFLGGTDPAAPRTDVRRERAALVAGVSPDRAPLGRWPGDIGKPLALSQQFAVNEIAALPDSGGLFAVNGPPGTGKTTLLRDGLASAVVERAGRLAELGSPQQAFPEMLGTFRLKDSFEVRVREPLADLTGFEVVLATGTNTAAENVTTEVPGVDAVRGAEEDALGIDYFTDIATRLLNAPAWGLIAAPLGNRSKRGDFVQRFWDGRSPNGDPATGMKHVLKNAGSDPAGIEDWPTAVERFRRAEGEVRRLAEERARVAAAVAELAEQEAELHTAEAAFAEARAESDRLGARFAEAEQDFAPVAARFQERDAEYQNHLQHKPGILRTLVTLFRDLRRWSHAHEELEEQRNAAKAERDHWAGQLEGMRNQIRATDIRVRDTRQRAQELRGSCRALQDTVDAARRKWPGNVVFGPDFADDDDFEKCSPWADPEYTAARNAMFLEALRLHKTFVLHAEKPVRNNLWAMTEVLNGKVRLPERELHAVWRTLFLVVPMVSTTFASLPKLFAGLGRESLGTLFIDEAGQATPQQAAGAIWRCKRAVVVGDPQQLEPIVTLPSPAQRALRLGYGVSEEWSPAGNSAQRVADGHARYGTALPAEDGSATWVGSPLRVHRRCEQPMFDIANTIAYGGTLMVYGTQHGTEYPARPSRWIHVTSNRSDGKWIPEEGQALQALLTRLTDTGITRDDIRVISPFRDVVHEAKAHAKEVLGGARHEQPVGTVHTAQGKESDVVVLVLGSGPKNRGAREWAAAKPNLLNVAASRARRRLYVIGDHTAWRGHPHFAELAARMPVHDD